MSDKLETLVADHEINNAPRPVAVGKALEVFSDNWSFSVLQELFFGVKRFDDFQRSLNISRSVLTRRLRHLESQNIISRYQYSTRPSRYEYRLTERGIDMYPIFVQLKSWGEKWLDDSHTSNLELIHTTCGHPLDVTVNCTSCNKEINARNVAVKKLK